MLWEVGHEYTEKDETDETVSAQVKRCGRRIYVHGEDEIEDVGGGKARASSTGSFYLKEAHGERPTECSEWSVVVAQTSTIRLNTTS